jgi:hypothetical protein
VPLPEADEVAVEMPLPLAAAIAVNPTLNYVESIEVTT